MRLNPFRLALGATLSASCFGAWLVPLLFIRHPMPFSLVLLVLLSSAGFGIWCLLELRKYN
jgi:hypothetical protein